jgi:hypothetical protein
VEGPPGGSEVVSKRMFKMFRWRVPQEAARLGRTIRVCSLRALSEPGLSQSLQY